MAEQKCEDRKCYIHGTVRVRGARVSGRVVSAKTRHTVIVEHETTGFIAKYKRREKRRSRIPAHNPPCINAKLGDMVNLGETRKISKTKTFTVLGVMEKQA
jgi:small subunit ribosomal protein S17